MRAMVLCAAVLLLSGCEILNKDVIKDIERGAYDDAAARLSEYCERTRNGGLWLQRTIIEARREIRQRGTNGPAGPTEPVEGLDDKTANGSGPVIIVWCGGETDGQGRPYPVPREVYERMVRDWRD